MKRYFLVVWLLVTGLLFGCSQGGRVDRISTENNSGASSDNGGISNQSMAVPKETTIALFLSSGITPYPTLEELVPLFPLTMEVQPAALLYDESDIVTILPAYGCPGGCRWIGDFTAGNVVEVITISADGNYCYANGETVQGWNATGWVSCARLSILPD